VSTLAELEGRSRAELAGRVIELETLCNEVLMVSVDAGLPQPLLNRLRAAVGRGAPQKAFRVHLPTGDPVVDALPDPLPPPEAPPIRIPDLRLSSTPPGGGAGAPETTTSELKPLPDRKTVLVVDDDPMMLNVLGRILERENFELLMAASGPDALKALDEHGGRLDLLVTDYAMPGMQGRELAERVRQRFPRVRVLYQTGFSDLLFDNCVELEDGAAFLEKPFTARGLREAARLVLFGTLNPA
jgi:CheY-like chemotaxis protein